MQSGTTAVRRITNGELPPPVSAYAHAVSAGSFLFVSGQVPVDPYTNTVVGDTIEEQTRAILAGLDRVLKAGGTGPENVVWMGIFLKHPEDFEGYNRVYQAYFHAGYPARATVSAGLLGEFRIEAWAIAWVPEPKESGSEQP